MILSDHTIKERIKAGQIVIRPLDRKCIQPSSIDLHLLHEFRVFKHAKYPLIDLKRKVGNYTELIVNKPSEAFIIHPGEFVLGSTEEIVRIPDDLVGRLEGKSSLGRLGIIIHASLPYDEDVYAEIDGTARLVKIGELVERISKTAKRVRVASFDPRTLRTAWFDVSDFIENPESHLYRLELESGRNVRLTESHNVFTLSASGEIHSTPTNDLKKGSFVAVPGQLPVTIPATMGNLPLDLLANGYVQNMLRGDIVPAIFEEKTSGIQAAARQLGYSDASVHSWQKTENLPFSVLQALPPAYYQTPFLARYDAFASSFGSAARVPALLELNDELGWILGFFTAEGHWTRKNVEFTTTDSSYASRVKDYFESIGVTVSTSVQKPAGHKKTYYAYACSKLLAEAFVCWGLAAKARHKRVPPCLYSAPRSVIRSFLDGYYAGDGSRLPNGQRAWTASENLASDLVYLETLLGRKAAYHPRRDLYELYVRETAHKLLEDVPNPRLLLRAIRDEQGLSLARFAEKVRVSATFLSNLEAGLYAGVKRRTLRRIAEALPRDTPLQRRFHTLAESDVRWDRVVRVQKTPATEKTYDLEVQPSGQLIENFVGGKGGVFLHNTAGYVDPGFDGHLTLEVSNVGKIPVALYPGMRIAQLSFIQMTTPADVPYGSRKLNSHYQKQKGPTESRIGERSKWLFR